MKNYDSLRTFSLDEHVVSSKKYNNKLGFTIVELLVVIVVIGILAAITIVSYTGISQRATVASLQSDLSNASTQLKMDQVVNGAFPGTLAAANSGKGIPASAGTSYQYQLSNSNPQTFCITATKSGQSYKINQGSAPSSGSCSITNLNPNPSFETDASIWSIGSSATAVKSSAQFHDGISSALVTHVNNGQFGNDYITMPAYNLTIGAKYTVSFWTKLDAGSPSYAATIQDGVIGGSVPSGFSNTTVTPTATWTRYTLTWTADNSTAYFLLDGNGAGAGETYYLDSVILTQDSTVYNYADGNSSGWTWSGATNLSTSTGLPI